MLPSTCPETMRSGDARLSICQSWCIEVETRKENNCVHWSEVSGRVPSIFVCLYINKSISWFSVLNYQFNGIQLLFMVKQQPDQNQEHWSNMVKTPSHLPIHFRLSLCIQQPAAKVGIHCKGDNASPASNIQGGRSGKSWKIIKE